MRKFYSLRVLYAALVIAGSASFTKASAQTLTLRTSYNISDTLFGGGFVGVAYINSEFWISKFNNDSLFRLNSSGRLLQKFTIPNVTGVRSMTYDGTFIYAGLSTNTIAKINPVTKTLVGTITAPVLTRFVTYNSTANNGAGGLWIGTAGLDFYLIDLNGNILRQILHEDHNLMSVYGLAYDSTADNGGPRLWAFDQGPNGTAANMVRVPISTGVPNYTYNVLSDFPGVANGYSGGAFISYSVIPNEKTLIVILQGIPSMLALYTVSSSTLPVTFKSFSGEGKGSVNSLKWTTASEQNNKGFEIQSSADGTSFKTIGFVVSKADNGNSVSDLTYSYDDLSPLKANNYYRLAQIDKDGKATYSATIVIKAEVLKAELTNVYPNPVSASLNIALNSAVYNKITLIITDIKGSLLMTKAVTANAGNNVLSLKVQSLKAGTYVLKVVGSDGQSVGETKFIKQ